MARPSYPGLDNYILRYTSSIIPLTSEELHRRIQDEYGFIEMRTFYRHLKSLSRKGHLIESISIYDKDRKYCYDTKKYLYRDKKKKTRPVFQKQYIEFLKRRVLAIRSL